MDKILLFFRKFASYILFIFTLLSFIFSENEILNIVFISLAFLAFFKINFFKLFSKERYLSKLELFFSILLFVRVLLLFDLHILYKFISYFMGVFFLIAYFISFSNIKEINTNLLGIKKSKEDLESDVDFDQEDDFDLDQEYAEDQEDQDETDPEDDFDLDQEDQDETDQEDDFNSDQEDQDETDPEDDFNLDNENIDEDDYKQLKENKNLKKVKKSSKIKK
jgi:predicted membrane protein